MILKKCSLILSCLSVSSIIAFNACKTSGDKEAVWEPDVYIGQPDQQAIVRDSDDGKKRVITCKEENFGMYVCMHKNDVEHMFKICLEGKSP